MAYDDQEKQDAAQANPSATQSDQNAAPVDNGQQGQLDPAADTQGASAAEPSANEDAGQYLSPGGVQAALKERQAIQSQGDSPAPPQARARLADDQMEAQLEAQERQQQAAEERQAGIQQRQQLAGNERYLRSQGVQFEVQPDGSSDVAYHQDENGNPDQTAPKFKPAVINPATWVPNADDQQNGGSWVKQTRDDRGNVNSTDLLNEGVLGKDYQRDAENGEYYVPLPGVDRQWLGQRDEGYLQQKFQTTITEAAKARQNEDTAQLAELKSQIADKQKAIQDMGITLPASADEEQKTQSDLKNGVLQAMQAASDARSSSLPDIASWLPGGQTREQKADDAVNVARQRLAENSDAKQAADELAQLQAQHTALSQQVENRRTYLANVTANATAQKYATAAAMAGVSPEDDQTAQALGLFTQKYGPGGTSQNSMARYPAEAIDHVTDDAGNVTDTVRQDFLLNRASAIAAMTSKSVADSYKLASQESKAQGLAVPDDPTNQPQLYKKAADGTVSFGKNDPMQAATQAALNGDLDPGKAAQMIRQAATIPPATQKAADNGVGAAQDFVGRVVTNNAITLNRGLEGLARFFHANDAADYFKQAADVSEDAKQGRIVDWVNPSREKTIGGVAGSVVGNIAGMSPAMMLGGPLGEAGGVIAAGTKLATIAKMAAGAIPMALQAAGQSGAEAYNQAKVTGQSDDQAMAAQHQAMLKTLPGLALYMGAGAIGGKIIAGATRLMPALETPWMRAAATLGVNAPLNVAASAGGRALAGGNPSDFTAEGVATDIAFAGHGALDAYSAARYLPTARAMVDGTHPEVLLNQSIATDKTEAPDERQKAAQAVMQMVSGAKDFLKQMGARAAVRQSDAAQTLSETDAQPDSADKRDAVSQATDQANFAVNQMAMSNPQATDTVMRGLVDPKNLSFAKQMIQPERATDPRSVVLAHVGQIAMDSGAVSRAQVDQARQAIVDAGVAPENQETVLRHSIGASVVGDTARSLLFGKALEHSDPAYNGPGKVDKGYLETLVKANIAHVAPDGLTGLNMHFAGLLPKETRERVIQRANSTMKAGGVNVPSDAIGRFGEWADTVRKGHIMLSELHRPKFATPIPPDDLKQPTYSQGAMEDVYDVSGYVKHGRADTAKQANHSNPNEQNTPSTAPVSGQEPALQVQDVQAEGGAQAPKATASEPVEQSQADTWAATPVNVDRAAGPDVVNPAPPAQHPEGGGSPATEGRPDNAPTGRESGAEATPEAQVLPAVGSAGGVRPEQATEGAEIASQEPRVLPQSEKEATASPKAATREAQTQEGTGETFNGAVVHPASEASGQREEAAQPTPVQEERPQAQAQDSQVASAENATRSEKAPSGQAPDVGRTLHESEHVALTLPKGATHLRAVDSTREPVVVDRKTAEGGALAGLGPYRDVQAGRMQGGKFAPVEGEVKAEARNPRESENYYSDKMPDLEDIYSKGEKGKEPPKLLKQAQVDQLAKAITKRLPNAPGIDVIQGYADLPEAVQQEYKDEAVKGFYNPRTGRVTIIADAIESVPDAVKVVVHELTHAGLDKVLSPDDYNKAMALVGIENTSKVVDVARRLNLDVRDSAQRRTATEEFLAETAANQGVFDKAVAFIKNAIQKMFPGVKFSDDEVRDLLNRSADYLRGSREETKDARSEGDARFEKANIGMRPNDGTVSGRSQGNPGPAPTDSAHPDARQSEFLGNSRPDSKGVQGDSDIKFSKGDAEDRDKAYLEAVRKGDTATAQNLADEAARKMGYARVVSSDSADPATLEPFNETQPAQVNRMVDILKKDGWNGRPLLTVDDTKALTGSHRLVAAAEAGLDEIPTVNISSDDLVRGLRDEAEKVNEKFNIHVDDLTDSEIYSRFEDGRDAERLRILNFLVDHGHDEFKDARDLYRIEEESNWQSDNIKDTLNSNPYVSDDGSVKSANAITRDDSGNVIPLSQRFDSKSDDIRFSKADKDKKQPELDYGQQVKAEAVARERGETPNKGPSAAEESKRLWSKVAGGLNGIVKRVTDALPGGELMRDAVTSAKDDVLKVAAPQTRGPVALETAHILQSENGEMHRAKMILQAKLDDVHAAVESMSKADQREFMLKLDEGGTTGDPDKDKVLALLRSTDRQKMEQDKATLHDLGNDTWEDFANFEKFTVPHLFKDQEATSRVYSKMLQGSVGFFKHRVDRTMREIIDYATKQGITLEPKSDNVLDMMFGRWAQHDKYIMAQRVFQALEGTRGYHWEGSDYVPKEDEARVDQKIGYRIKTEKVPLGSVKDGSARDYADALRARRAKLEEKLAAPGTNKDFTEQQMREIDAKLAKLVSNAGRQYFYGPKEGVQLIDNHLSTGLQGKAWYRAYMQMGNILNQAQLLGFFHLGFVSAESMTSKVALGLNQLAKGQLVDAAKSLNPLAVLASPVTSARTGDAMMKAYLTKMGSPDMLKAVQLAVAGGAKFGNEEIYKSQFSKAMMRGFREGSMAGITKGVLSAPFALAEKFAAPLMDHLVPRMKLGVIHDLAQMELKANPNMTPEEFRAAGSRIVASADNRMGQMTYDNLHWNKVFKDVLMASTRSVGWNIGTFRELGGGAVDFAKAGKGLLTGKGAETTYRMAYCMALPMVAGTLGAAIHYMATGQWPEELKDYFYPKSGGVNPDGTAARVSLPTYMKDVFAYATHPGTTLSHKVHPLISTVLAMMANKDYYGIKIANEDDKWHEQAMSELKFLGKQAVPFSLTGTQKLAQAGASPLALAGSLVGVAPAPGSITQSAAMNKAAELVERNMGSNSPARTQAQADRSAARTAAVQALRRGDSTVLQQALQVKTVEPSDVRKIQEDARHTPLQARVMHLNPTQAQQVYDIATPQEKKELAPVIAYLRQNALKKDQRSQRMTAMPAGYQPFAPHGRG